MLNEVIVGKWNKNRYKILEKIGKGSMGVVYKIKDSAGKIRAMKISEDITNTTREFNIMKKIDWLGIIPKVYEIDDYIKNDNIYNFFIMDYIEGKNLKDIIINNKVNPYEIVGIGIILIDTLEKLNELGYIYGDIKLENILLDRRRKKIMLVDCGGVIENTKPIREYTPTYNMTSWGIGLNEDRDKGIVFSISMIMTSMILKREFSPFKNTIDDVKHNIEVSKIDEELIGIIKKGFDFKYRDTDLFKYDLKNILNKLKRVDENTKKIDIIDIIFYTSIGVFVIVMTVCIKIYFK